MSSHKDSGEQSKARVLAHSVGVKRMREVQGTGDEPTPCLRLSARVKGKD